MSITSFPDILIKANAATPGGVDNAMILVSKLYNLIKVKCKGTHLINFKIYIIFITK